MSVFKKLDTKDVYLSDYISKKSWRLLGQDVLDAGIRILYGESGSLSIFSEKEHPQLVYQSINHLYYEQDGRRDLPQNWDPCTIPQRTLSGSILALSVPRTVFGHRIEPGTFELAPSKEESTFYLPLPTLTQVSDIGSDQEFYNLALYWENGHGVVDIGENINLRLVTREGEIYTQTITIQDAENIYASIDRQQENVDFLVEKLINHPELFTVLVETVWDEDTESLYVEDEYVRDGYVESAFIPYLVWDDGRGTLYNPVTGQEKGYIIYNQGQVLITDPTLISFYRWNQTKMEVKWKSNLAIYTLNANCTVRNTEMNLSLNPSLTESVSGSVYPQYLGTEFSPYITTIGLYNERNELLMVGKLNQPVRKSKETDMVFKISLDI